MWQAGAPAGKAAATRASLKQANIKAKKSLGQNFLTDERILADIVAAAGVGPCDAVLEVGPGTGNLTRFLVASGARVVAVEKDDTLIERLRAEFSGADNLELVHGDVLRVDLPRLLRRMLDDSGSGDAAQAATGVLPGGGEAAPAAAGAAALASETRAGPGPSSLAAAEVAAAAAQQQTQAQRRRPAGPKGSGGGGGAAAAPPQRVKVVANLPYNITTEFLQALLPQGSLVSELSIMIQEEPARRLVSGVPGKPDYRAMSVITHYYSRPAYRFRIPRDRYFPAPNVDGALVTFRLLAPPRRAHVPSERSFVQLVCDGAQAPSAWAGLLHASVGHACVYDTNAPAMSVAVASQVNQGFSQRRKKLRNALQPAYDGAMVEAALVACQLRGDARAQDLSVEQFVALHWELHHRLLAPADATSQQSAAAEAA